LRPGLDPQRTHRTPWPRAPGYSPEQGILKFCRQKSIVSERVKLKSEPHWYPYNRNSSQLQARMVRLLGAKDWRPGVPG